MTRRNFLGVVLAAPLFALLPKPAQAKESAKAIVIRDMVYTERVNFYLPSNSTMRLERCTFHEHVMIHTETQGGAK